tara:strand:+ start:132 stop:1001 length:870 start_codon:yes stop_codon:yes gene_type:complete
VETLILGHNPLFGIHHGSQKAGNLKAMRFNGAEKIIAFLEKANSFGVNKMMLSTHPKAFEMLNQLKKQSLKDGLTFYPMIPYMQKYIQKANEGGVFGLIKEIVKSSGMWSGFSSLKNAALGTITSNAGKLIKSALEIELTVFQEFNCGRVFLHNSLTDLALGFNTPAPIKIFKEYIEDKLELKSGFGTLNLPFALKRFASWGLKGECFLAPFNSLSHQMNPNLERNLESLLDYPDNRVFAMSTLASGLVKPAKAFEFLSGIENIESAVVGMSTEDHIKNTVSEFEKFCK